MAEGFRAAVENMNEFLAYKEKVLRRIREVHGPEAELETVEMTHDEFVRFALDEDDPDDRLVLENLHRNHSSEPARELSFHALEAYLRDERRLIAHHLGMDAFVVNGLPNTVIGSDDMVQLFSRQEKDRKKRLKQRLDSEADGRVFRYRAVEDEEEDAATAAAATKKAEDDVPMEIDDGGAPATGATEPWIGDGVETLFEGGPASPTPTTAPAKATATRSKRGSGHPTLPPEKRTLYEMLPDPSVCRVFFANVRAERAREEPGENVVERCILEEKDYVVPVRMDHCVEIKYCTLRNAQVLLGWNEWSYERLSAYRASEAWANGEPMEPTSWAELIRRYAHDDERTSLTFRRARRERVSEPEDDGHPDCVYHVTRTFKSVPVGHMLIPSGCSLCPRRRDRDMAPHGCVFVNGKRKALLPQQDNSPMRFKLRVVKNANAPEEAWPLVGSITNRYRQENAAIVVHSITLARVTTSRNPYWARFSSTVNNEMPLVHLLSALGATGFEDVADRVCRYERDPAKVPALRALVRAKLGKDPAHGADAAAASTEEWPDELLSLRVLGVTLVRKTGYRNQRMRGKRKKDRQWTDATEKSLLQSAEPSSAPGAGTAACAAEDSFGGAVGESASFSGSIGGAGSFAAGIGPPVPGVAFASASHAPGDAGAGTGGAPESPEAATQPPIGGATAEVKRGRYCLNQHVFPWLRKNTGLKLETICFYLYRMLRVERGDDAVDPKDALGDKYCVTSYEFMTKIFNDWRQKTIKPDMKQHLGRLYVKPLRKGLLDDDFDTIFRVMTSIDEPVKKHVSSGKYPDGYVNVTTSPETHNLVALYADLRRSVQRMKNAGRKGGMLEVREFGLDWHPFVCVVRNPDGKNTGLVPFLSMLCQLSEGSHAGEVVELLESRVRLAFAPCPSSRTGLRRASGVEQRVSVERTTPERAAALAEEERARGGPHPFGVPFVAPNHRPRRDLEVVVTLVGAAPDAEGRPTCLGDDGVSATAYRPPDAGYALLVEDVCAVEPSAHAHLSPDAVVAIVTAAKRHGLIHRHVGVNRNARTHSVHVRTGMGRYVFPVFSAEFLGDDLDAARREALRGGWTRLERKGHVFWTDPHEFRSRNVAPYVDDYYARLGTPEAHDCAMVHPCAALSLSANWPPKPNHNTAVRQSYASGIINQFVSAPWRSPLKPLNASSMHLVHPMMPLVSTLPYRCLGLMDRPDGVNLKHVLGTLDGLGIEDAINILETNDMIGVLDCVKTKVLTFVETFDPTLNRRTALGTPRRFGTHHARRIDYLDENHVAAPGTVLGDRDVAIAASQMSIVDYNRAINALATKTALEQMERTVLRRFHESRRGAPADLRDRVCLLPDSEEDAAVDPADASVRVVDFERCVVRATSVTEFRDPRYGVILRRVRMVLSRLEPMGIADKASTKHPLKGMRASAVPYDRMYHDPDTGVAADVIINPTSFSRNTRGLEHESALGVLATSHTPELGLGLKDGTAYESRDHSEVYAGLRGPTGKPFEKCAKRLVSGVTGRLTDEPMTQGFNSEGVLRHKAPYKFAACSTCPVSAHTRQPIGGRTNDGGGGGRIGEMENDNFRGHGAYYFLHQTRGETSHFTVPVCPKCGLVQGVEPVLDEILAAEKAARIRARHAHPALGSSAPAKPVGSRVEDGHPLPPDPNFDLRVYRCRVCNDEEIQPVPLSGPYVTNHVLCNELLSSGVYMRFEVGPPAVAVE